MRNGIAMRRGVGGSLCYLYIAKISDKRDNNITTKLCIGDSYMRLVYTSIKKLA